MRALVTGATGFLGRALVRRLDRPVVLSRDPVKARATLGPVDAFRWEPSDALPTLEALDGVDAVFHLAGESVGEGRWTPARKAAIRDSRVNGTGRLVRALSMLPRRPEVLVCASAVGFYGSRGDEVLDESKGPGKGFLAEVCAAWEAEAAQARSFGMRVVLARFGLVLGAGGGALAAMLPLYRAGLGGPIGLGGQWVPWVAIDDTVGMLLHAAATPAMDGPMNVVGPAPVRQREFAHALGKAVHRPALLPVPRVALRLAVGEMSEMLRASQRAVPAAATATGYLHACPDLASALQAALHVGL